jgi:hypothetical protein
METATVRHETPEAIAIEATIIGPEGQTATAGGGFVSADLVYAYVSGDGKHTDNDGTYRKSRGPLTLWDGTRIGTWFSVNRWDRWTAYDRYTMHAIEAVISYGPAKGTYHGRYNEDGGQLVTLRPKRTK